MFRKIIKKFNNFKTTATFTFIFSALTAVYGLGVFLCYNFAGDIKNGMRDVGFEASKTGQLMGMILFLLAVVTVASAIVVAYNLIPAMLNKEKVMPKKVFLGVSFGGAIFEAGLCVMSILLLVLDEPKTDIFILASLPLFAVTFLASIFEFILMLNCDFYMPEIVKK